MFPLKLNKYSIYFALNSEGGQFLLHQRMLKMFSNAHNNIVKRKHCNNISTHIDKGRLVPLVPANKRTYELREFIEILD